MFFGNMQSFYRRNSIRSPTSSQSSKQSKEQISRKQMQNRSRRDDSEDCRSKNRVSIRGNTFSTSTYNEDEEQANEAERSNVPIIKIGMYEPETSKKSFNILKEKEKALWFNNSPDLDDNSERLGPNKNNIIEETLGCERRKGGHWGSKHSGGITSAEDKFL